MDGGELIFSTTFKSQVMSERSSERFILRFKLSFTKRPFASDFIFIVTTP